MLGPALNAGFQRHRGHAGRRSPRLPARKSGRPTRCAPWSREPVVNQHVPSLEVLEQNRLERTPIKLYHSRRRRNNLCVRRIVGAGFDTTPKNNLLTRAPSCVLDLFPQRNGERPCPLPRTRPQPGAEVAPSQPLGLRIEVRTMLGCGLTSWTAPAASRRFTARSAVRPANSQIRS